MSRNTAGESTPIEVVWEAPPDRTKFTRHSMYDDALDMLKKNPGRWARVRVVEVLGTAHSSVATLKKRADGDPRLEMRVGALDNGDGFGVWARYRTPEQMREDER